MLREVVEAGGEQELVRRLVEGLLQSPALTADGAGVPDDH